MIHLKAIYDYIHIGKIFSSFKDYRFNSILIKNFILILLVLVIPILTLVFAIYIYNIRIMEKDLLENNSNMAISVKNLLDNLVDDSRYATLKLASNIDILDFSEIIQLGKDYSGISMIDAVQKQISSAINASKAVSDILISFSNTNYLIASDSAWTNTNGSSLRGMPSILFTEERSAVKNIPYLKNGANLYFKSDIRAFGSYRGTVVGKVNIYKLASSTRSILQNPDSSVLIADKNGDVVMDSHNTYAGANISDIKGLAGFLRSNRENGFIDDGGERNMVYIVKSGNENWNYILITPAGIYQQRLHSLGFVLALLIAASLIITIFASWLITYKLYRPVQIITEVLKNPEQSVQGLDIADYKKLDEVGFISSSIRYTQRQNFIIKTELDMKNELLKNAQTVALQAQINPHFLNNTLESINWKALDFFGGKQNDISMMLSDLSRLLKVSLDSRSFLVKTQQELEHARLYVRLQTYRLKDRLNVEWVIDENLLEYKTIKLSLQPLIENAISHGIKHIEGKGNIRVICRSVDDRVEFVVEDNGRGIEEENLGLIKRKLDDSVLSSSEHLGLANINQRVKLYFGMAYGIEIESTHEIGTKVILSIPKVN